MNIKKKRTNFLLVIIIVILLFFFALLQRNILMPEKIIKDISLISMEVLSRPFHFFKPPIDYDENLKIQIEELEYQIALLEEAYDFDSNLLNKKLINATVLNRNIGLWFDNLTINKGSQNGVNKGAPVIVSGVLIGVIEDVSYFNSHVQLLTSAKMTSKVSVKINIDDDYEYGVLFKYDEKNDLFLLEGFREEIDIADDMLVTTTGLTENYPPGIIIGKVVDMEYDSYGLSQVIRVKPLVNYDQIHYVTVLGEKN